MGTKVMRSGPAWCVSSKHPFEGVSSILAQLQCMCVYNFNIIPGCSKYTSGTLLSMPGLADTSTTGDVRPQ